MEFSGWNGFLGTRASFMLDLVVVAMVVVRDRDGLEHSPGQNPQAIYAA